VSVLAWLIVGFVAGGLARVATGAEKKGCLGTIVVGILGALIGGGLWRFATGSDTDAFSELQWSSILVAFIGASALLLLMQAFGGNKSRGRRY